MIDIDDFASTEETRDFLLSEIVDIQKSIGNKASIELGLVKNIDQAAEFSRVIRGDGYASFKKCFNALLLLDVSVGFRGEKFLNIDDLMYSVSSYVEKLVKENFENIKDCADKISSDRSMVSRVVNQHDRMTIRSTLDLYFLLRKYLKIKK